MLQNFRLDDKVLKTRLNMCRRFVERVDDLAMI